MSRFHQSIFLLCLPGILFAAASPKEDAQRTFGRRKEASPTEIARLIRQLGSDSFQQREAASTALAAIGEPALEPLRKASASAQMRRWFRGPQG